MFGRYEHLKSCDLCKNSTALPVLRCIHMVDLASGEYTPCSVARGAASKEVLSIQQIVGNVPTTVEHPKSTIARYRTISINCCGPNGHWFEREEPPK